MVMAEKTGLCLQMDGPISSYCARVWQTVLNSGVDASIDPPNHTANLCMWCELRVGEGSKACGLGSGSSEVSGRIAGCTHSANTV